MTTALTPDAHRLPDWVYEVAPCLSDSPYADQARKLVAVALAIGPGRYGDMLKVLCSYNLVHYKHNLEKQIDIEPVGYFKKALTAATKQLEASWQARSPLTYPEPGDKHYASIEEETADHYGNLFAEFDDWTYYEEPVELLRQRLARTGYPLEKFPDWTGLDAGCGSGRYTHALRQLGFRHVTGVDLSELNIATATQRAAARAVSGLEYRRGNVLDLPCESKSFDFVLSNGVLHHTRDAAKGVRELLRVLRPGGCGYFKVMAKPGGIHWDTIEILRIVLKDVDQGFARDVYRSLGVPANLRYLFLDHMQAPINIRYTRPECEQMLADAGAVNIRWLERGADVDRNERAFRGEPHAEVKYGLGENRYYFEKPQ